jgi:MSHA biogenesis protein MshN
MCAQRLATPKVPSRAAGWRWESEVSLINQMLRDLDRRQASASERSGLASQVRALPPERRFPWSRVLLLIAGGALGAAAVWLLLDSRNPPSVSPTAAVAAHVVPPPAAAVTPEAPVVALPTLVVPMPADERETELPERAAPPSPLAAVDALKLDSRLSPVATVRDVAVAPAPTARVPPGGGHGPTTIDKHPREVAGANPAEDEYRKAMAAYRQGRTSEALAGFQNALRGDARHVAARQALLSLLMAQSRWPEAQSLAAEGLALDSAQPGWAMVLARLQVEQGRLGDAQDTMARHAAYGGERSADYQAFHALILQKLQRRQEAVEHFRAATVLRPNEGRWWYGLGLALEADQRPAEARDAFRQARDAGNLPAELAAAVDAHLR